MQLKDVSNFSLKQSITIILISLMLLIENIDGNIVNIAIPTIAISLHISALSLKLAVTSYLISLAIFIPISGWIADKFGTKKVLFAAISLFAIFSLLCGIAQSLSQLVIFRFCQGIAGAFMAPVGRLLLLKVFNKTDLVKVYILMAMPVVLGPLLAPVLGGVLIEYLNWRYIFWVNIPISLFGLIVTYWYVDNYLRPTQKFNWWSFIYLSLFLAILSFSLDVISYAKSLQQWWLIILGLIFLALYLKVELPSQNRIVNYNLFKIKTFRLCFYSNCLIRLTFGGRSFVLALFLQLSLQMTPLNAAYLLSCFAIGLLLGRMVVKKLLFLNGFKLTLIIANWGAVISLFLFCGIRQINFYTIILFIGNGFFSSICFILLNILCFAKVKEIDYASSTSITNTASQLSISLGVGIVALSLNLFNQIFSQFSPMVFHATFIFLALIGILNSWVLAKLSPNDGQNLLTAKKLTT